MKCCFITSLFPNNVEPFKAVFNERIAQEISKKIEVNVIAPVPWFPSWNVLETLLPGYSRMAKVKRVESRRNLIVRHPRFFIFPKLLRSLHGFSYGLSLVLKNKAYKFVDGSTIIYSPYAYPDGFGSVLLAKAYRRPIIIHVQGCDINLLCQLNLHRWLIRWALKQSDAVIAVSNEMKGTLEDLGIDPAKIRVITNGVDTETFFPRDLDDCRKKLGIPLGRFVVLFVGSLEEVKGVEVLIPAFKRLLAVHADSLLYLVGEGSRRAEYERLVKDMGLAGSVVFKGVMDHESLSFWYNACDVFCLPSIREGYPNVLLEAKSCGKTIVATRVGGISEILRPNDGDRLVDPSDWNELGAALIALAVNGRFFVERGEVKTWKDMGQELFECLKGVSKTDEP